MGVVVFYFKRNLNYVMKKFVLAWCFVVFKKISNEITDYIN